MTEIKTSARALFKYPKLLKMTQIKTAARARLNYQEILKHDWDQYCSKGNGWRPIGHYQGFVIS